MYRVLSGTAALCVVGHTAYVYRLRDESPKSFPVGSINDMILNRLKPGSILLYNRRWYDNYLPHALAILLLKCVDGDDDNSFDHAGVFVTDNIGTPFVLELGPLGYVLTPYVSAVMSTPAKCVALLPLHYNDSQDITIRKQLHNHAKEMTQDTSSIGLAKIVTYALNRALRRDAVSPSYEVVRELYRHIEIDIDDNIANFTTNAPSLNVLKSYMSGVPLVCSDSISGENLQPQFGQSTILRRQH